VCRRYRYWQTGKEPRWAIDEPDEEGTDLDACINTLIFSLGKGPVALGFEAPQFVPIRNDLLTLTAGRKGEFRRAFSAGAGATVLVTSLVVVPYVLRADAFLRLAVGLDPTPIRVPV
jgi:hypothetical protein